MFFGCHLSATGGNAAMVKTALSIGANTFAFFTRNPRGSKAKKEDPADAAKAVAMLEENGFGPLVAHGAYTMNLCTADPEARALRRKFWKMICVVWGLCLVIFIIFTPAAMWARVRKPVSNISLPH